MNILLLRSLMVGLVSVSFGSALYAQSPTSEQLKSLVAARQERVNLLRDEIVQTDGRIESRLDIIIGALTAITDSKNSRTKVAQMKAETGKKLMKSIGYYDLKRAALKEELRNPRLQLTNQEKEKMIAVFDARIEKRTSQILALYKSMPAYEEHEPNRVTSDAWGNTYQQRNSDYDQARRMTSHSNKQRDAIVKQLDASIGRLDRQSRTLKAQLAAATDPAQKAALGKEIAENDALIAERRKQRAETLMSSGAGGREVSLNEALDLDKALETATKDLSQEFTTLFQRYNTLLVDLSNLHTMEVALAKAGR